MKKPNAKERILRTAGDLFFQRGYSAVGINEIIEKAGTAKASFYQHYPSKESLCEAWLHSIHEQAEERRSQLLQSDASPEEKVDAYFAHLEVYLVESHYRGCPFSNTGAVSFEKCPTISAQIRQHKESTRAFFRKLAAQVVADPTRSDEIGDRIFVLYSGATSEAQNLREIWPVLVARSAARDMLRNH